jgi:hypothetical protein
MDRWVGVVEIEPDVKAPPRLDPRTALDQHAAEADVARVPQELARYEAAGYSYGAGNAGVSTPPHRERSGEVPEEEARLSGIDICIANRLTGAGGGSPGAPLPHDREMASGNRSGRAFEGRTDGISREMPRQRVADEDGVRPFQKSLRDDLLAGSPGPDLEPPSPEEAPLAGEQSV